MEFGSIPYDGLTQQHFVLEIPDDLVFPEREQADFYLHVGLSRMDHKDWQSSLYPAGTIEAEKFNCYTSRFNMIEFNATHYKSYAEQQYLKWKAQAGNNNFHFCPKFPKSVNYFIHANQIETAVDKTLQFFQEINAFGENLGPAFLQLAPTVDISRQENLLHFLSKIVASHKTFIEVRHESWFENAIQMDRFSEALSDINIGWIITDTPGRRDVLHFLFPTRQLFVRFVCQGDHPLDYHRINQWKAVLESLIEKGLEDCWFVVHAHNETAAVPFTDFVLKEFSSLLPADHYKTISGILPQS